MSDLPADPEAADLIRELNLARHPEGGWYRETWRTPKGPDGRSTETSIHFLLSRPERSHWHRVDVAETWRYTAGAPLALSLFRSGKRETIMLGREPGQVASFEIPPHLWQAAATTGAWTLVGCDCRPGFEFSGFELAPPNWEPEQA